MESRAIKIVMKRYIWVLWWRYSFCEHLGLLLHKLKQFCCSDNSKEAQIPMAFYSLSSKPPSIITITKLILTPEEILIRQEIEQSTMNPELHKQWLSNTHNCLVNWRLPNLYINEFSLSSQRRKPMHFPTIWSSVSLKMNGFIYFWGLYSSSKFGWN